MQATQSFHREREESKKSEYRPPLTVWHCLGCQQIKDCVTTSRTLMLSLISAMCHKLQQQSIQPFWPHPTCCHTEKNETVGEIFAEQRLSFVKTYVAKKFSFTFMEVEKEASGVT